jgi:hypothetical protein
MNIDENVWDSVEVYKINTMKIGELVWDNIRVLEREKIGDLKIPKEYMFPLFEPVWDAIMSGPWRMTYQQIQENLKTKTQ